MSRAEVPTDYLEIQSEARALIAATASVVTFLVTGALAVEDIAQAIDLKEIPSAPEVLLGVVAGLLFLREAKRQPKPNASYF